MGENSRDLKEQIGEARERLGRNLDELQSKVKETIDWRSQFRQRPMTMIAVAFAVGIWLSTKL